MTTTDRKMVRRQGRAPVPLRQPSPSALRRSAVIRVGIALLVAGAITAAAIAARWAPLSAKSDVIGYPIFADFNPNNYVYAYYLVVGLFPIAALLIFLGLTWIGPRIGLPTPPSRGRLRPLTSPGTTEPSLDSKPLSQPNVRVGVAARVVFVGAVLGLEVGIAWNHLWLSVVVAVLCYSLVVALTSVALRTVMPGHSTWEARVVTVNAFGTSLTVAGLSLVSAHTEVRVLSANAVRHYPWFPAWLGVPLAAALFGWIFFSLCRSGSAAAALERRAVVLVAAPVALFVLVARLPGDLGQIGLFEEGQSVVETMLVGHGWLPWRDVVLTHGLLGDVAPVAVGWSVFGDSYWGAYAGASVIAYPFAVVATYWLLAYLVGRSWPLLFIAALIFVGSWIGVTDPRFLSWWVILLLLAALLKQPRRLRAVAVGVLLAAQAIITLELGPAVVAVLVVVAAYEWYWWTPDAPVRQVFRRTIWLAIGAVGTAIAFAIYMAARGALGEFFSVTLGLLGGHFSQGVSPTLSGGFSLGRFDLIALAPVAALLISFAYAVTWLRLRRPFLATDWPMAAAALFLLIYYSKFLARMDLPHAYEPFMVATPLMLYIVYRVVTAAERWIRVRLPIMRGGWVTAHPVGVALLIVFVAYFWGALHTTVDATPAGYRPAVPEAPAFARVGYASQADGPAIEDLQQILNAYLGQHGRLLDITDEPALFYYFLGHYPSSRWFAPDGLTDTASLQRNLLAQLRRALPKLIVFDDTDGKMYGLQSMDGVPAPEFAYLVSRWILRHYRPLLESHGRTVYALPGVPPVESLHLHFQQQPATVGVRFLGQACSWGDAPTFLAGPAEPPTDARTVLARTTLVHGAQVTFTGWAGDVRAREPAREVIATFNGRIVARATPHIGRPDVPAAGNPSGFLRSGFQLSIPTWANAPKALRVLAIGRNGSVGQLPIPNQTVQGGVVKIGNRTAALQPTADTGHVDTEIASGALLQIEPPAGSMWRDYGWLEVDAPRAEGFLAGPSYISDRPGLTDPGRMITFDTLQRSPLKYVIPVSSCQQWYGYGSSRLLLTPPPGQEIAGIRLIR